MKQRITFLAAKAYPKLITSQRPRGRNSAYNFKIVRSAPNKRWVHPATFGNKVATPEQASVANERQQPVESSPVPVRKMRKTALLTNDDARRSSAEEFIRNTYAARYGARLETFPSRIFALLDYRDEVLCAAGLRFFDDGFFSESYLDTPIEDVVSAISARAVNRNAIFEVTTLASRAPLATAEFIAEIGTFGEKAGFEWSFFTLTRRLQLLIGRLGIAPTFLGEADRRRIADAERWGTYYDCQPKVYAVASRRPKTSGDGSQRREQYAATI